MENKTFIIAEAGVNHNGSFDDAKKLIDVAKASGVDAVKFQTFKSDEVVTKKAPKAEYQKKSSSGNTQYEMISKLQLSYDEFIKLSEYCKECELMFLSTPFDLESLDFLINIIDVPLIKIASGEITNAPLLYHAALSDKPIILSTGMSLLSEIKTALGVLAFGYIEKKARPTISHFNEVLNNEYGQQTLKEKVTLLHCTSAYPTPFNEVNLKVLGTLQQTFLLSVGFSDHSLGIYASVGAVCFGARVIEKHFTLDKSQIGPDHAASLSPQELNELVQAIRQIELCMGEGEKKPTASEMLNREICRRSLVVRKAVLPGEVFTQDILCAKRPGNGISPMHYWEWLDKVVDKPYLVDEIIEM